MQNLLCQKKWNFAFSLEITNKREIVNIFLPSNMFSQVFMLFKIVVQIFFIFRLV
jgi:hypothetical protein